MCVYKRYITNALGKDILVSCGKCPACQQARALTRTNKIRANFPDSGTSSPLVALFVTLTYANDFVPYIKPLEVDSSEVFKVDDPDDDFFNACGKVYSGMRYRKVNIYRDCSARYVRVSKGLHNYKFRKKTYRKRSLLSVVPVPVMDWEASRSSLKNVRGKMNIDDKVSVVYIKDVQDFIKRLRSNLSYKGYEKHLSIYQCSEYGPKTCRCHFHLLVFCSMEDYNLLSSAIVQAWPYDDGIRTRKNIEIARNAASYVSSYVNCSSFVPPLFTDIKAFRPKSTTSQGFGLALKCYSLAQVFEAYKRGDLHVNVWRYKKSAFVVDHILLPKYVLNRYFPKIKGYSRLTTDALQLLCEYPSELRRLAVERRLDYTPDDFTRNLAMLDNAWQRCKSIGLSITQFADVYSRIWTLRASQLYRDELENLDCINANFYAYDNIGQYLQGDVGSLSFDELLTKTDYVPTTIDFNEFPKARQVTANLEAAYYNYSKSKEIRNFVYSKIMHV